jgi:hypothetical protein
MGADETQIEASTSACSMMRLNAIESPLSPPPPLLASEGKRKPADN